MKKTNPLTLIALIVLLLISNAAGAARAAGLAVQPKLEILSTWEFYGEVQGVQLGYAVAGAGDVNGDGKADILVGAANGGVTKEGQALLFLGSASGPHDLVDWQAFGNSQGDDFGAALDGAGDVNGDGYDDIVVGAGHYTVSSLEAGEGAAYVYHGSASGPGLTADWMIEGNLKNGSFGSAVAGAGDINDDGFADVVVGMPGYSDIYGNYGAAFMYLGSEDGLGSTPTWFDYGAQAGSLFGIEVNPAGDVNGDGYDDVLVGQPSYDNYVDAITYFNAGAVYLYLGNQFSLSNVHAWSYFGYRGDDRLGTSAASAGDLNNDGCDDIAVGAPGYDQGPVLNTGRVYVFYGCQDTASGLNDTPDWVYSYPQEGANTGIDVSSAGDTNDDGYDELLVGANLYDDEQANEGTVFAFFGSPSGLPTQPGWQVDGNKNDTDFGFAVDGAGDTNGDGYPDVLIGSPQFRIETENRGAAFLYFGMQYASIYQTHLPFIRK